MGKMIKVECAEEARFFPQRVISRIASIAAKFYTSKRLDDPPSGRFWTLIPDGNVYPEMLLVPSATGSVWLDGRNKPILTTMTLGGFLPTDPAAQEHELLCRTIELGLTFDQLQGAELSCFELPARRLQRLEMELRDKVAGSLFGGSIEETATFIMGQARLVGCS